MRFLYIILFVIYIINNCVSLEAPKLYRCGFDNEKEKPILLKGYKPINKTNNLYKRRLDPDGFKDFKIYLDVVNVESDISLNGLDKYHDLFINSMKKAVETIQSLLKVRPHTVEYSFTDPQILALNIKNWNKNIVGTSATLSGKTMTNLDIDLIIYGTIETLGGSTLASASAKYSDPDTGQPIIGLVKINKEVDYSKEKSQEYFQAIVLHEFTHILGFSIQSFNDFYHNVETRLDDFGIMRTYITSSRVVEVAKKYFNCPQLTGVELEESGGEGTAGSHWEARILLGDYMNGYAYTEEMVVSEFTLALLEDTGYYKANYYTGGLMRFGKNKGCEFVKGKCIDKDTKKLSNPLFYNEFYDAINLAGLINPSCSPGRQSRTYSAIWSYSDIPEEYQYFGNAEAGGYAPADYCPVPTKHSDEEEKVNFAGQCSIKGSGEYGSKIKYSSEYISPLSKNMLAVTGEILSDHSFCFLSSLTKNTLHISNVYSSVIRAVCYEIFCSSKSLTVKIFDDYFVCPREGGKVFVDGYDGYILCPDYYLMCSGTVMCNDIFDCVEKKSETKEDSYLYDYTPKTSQNIEESIDLDPDQTNNYELSDDGICPKNCKHCKEQNKCKICIDDYSLEGIISEDKIICTKNSELTDGYYIDENNIYYKCIQNCELCSDTTGCDKCMRGYVLSNNACITQENIISNCHEYDTNQNCIKCSKDFAFIGTDRTNCVRLNTLLRYYTLDEGVSYYPCQDKNPNCSRCYYNSEEDKVKCTLCKNDLILVNINEGICYNKSALNDKTKYVLVNKTHGEICSKAIPDCEECESSIKCKKCKNNYYFNNYQIKCLSKEEVIINYPQTNQNNEEDSTNNNKDNNKNNGAFLNIKKSIIIQIYLLLILLL